MREDVQQLVQVQELDQKIATIRKELERIPKEQELAKERLANDEAALATAKTTFQENEIAIKNVELDVGTRRDTIAKLKVQQFETKKNEEYQKLGEEVTRYEGMIDELETQELELMEVADQCRQTISDAETSLAKTQKIVDEEISGLDARAEARKVELTELEASRTEEAAKVEEDLLTDYERLFIKREGKAVCAVTLERSCTSCHVQVTPATFIAAKSGETIAECDNCGSIVYLA